MKDTRAVWQVRRAFSGEVREKKQAIATGSDYADLFLELGVAPAEKLAYVLGNQR